MGGENESPGSCHDSAVTSNVFGNLSDLGHSSLRTSFQSIDFLFNDWNG